MKIKSKLMFFIWIFLMILSISQLCTALEPKLLWKKKISSQIDRFSFAKGSGDVIFIHERKNRITLIDKYGNIGWQWGPSLKRMAGQVSISDDGTCFVYHTDFPGETDAPEKPFIHYYDRSKGEIWRKELAGYPTISPDGKYVYVTTGWEGATGWLLDSKGDILWKKRDVGPDLGRFSPDGNFIWDGSQLLDKKGNTVLDKEFPGTLRSISLNADYLAFEGRGSAVIVRDKDGTVIGTGADGGILDKSGNIILGGKARVSGDGTIGIIYKSDKTEIYKLPEKTLVKEYPIRKALGTSSLSYNGNVIVIIERTGKESPIKLFIIDLLKNELYEEIIDEGASLDVSKDGKYFLMRRKSEISFFEIQ